MRRAFVWFRDSILLSLLLFTIVCSNVRFAFGSSGSSVIRVPQDYATIREAVVAANPGDIIVVSAGTYYGGAIVNKSVSIIGGDPTSTLVDGSFCINVDNVTISGLTFVYVCLHNVQGCNISYNILCPDFQAILLEHSNNNLITYNNISGGTNANLVELWYSSNNIVKGNHICNSDIAGIAVTVAANNSIKQNTLEDNYCGINILEGSYNLVNENSLENNEYCVTVSGIGNRIYHNNIFGNRKIMATSGSFWDNGAEGNYWNDYNGTDFNGDGIGDTCLPWWGVDYYPLMAAWSMLNMFYVAVNETTYPFSIFSNSTVASFRFDYSLGQITFNVTGPFSSSGFCSVTVPRALFSGALIVLIDDTWVNAIFGENATHVFTKFSYEHSTRRIRMLIPRLIGDVNFDGVVNILDIVLVAEAYGSVQGGTDWNQLADIAPPFGFVNILDLVTVAFHYGSS